MDSRFHHLVFFGVLLSIAIQGSTLGLLARVLNLTTPARPRPLFNLELITLAESDYDVIVIDLLDPQGAIRPRIADLLLPTGAVIIMITRGKDLVIPKGSTHLQGWDQVTVLAHASDHETIQSNFKHVSPTL